MQNVKIFCFSATGNTKRIANLYKENFEKNGTNAIVENITVNAENISIDDMDAIGVAYPIHGFNTPEIVINFAKKMPVGNGVYTFFIRTSGEPLHINDASSKELAEILTKKGYKVSLDHYYTMPYNMVFRHSDAMAAKMLNTAKARIPKRIMQIINMEEKEMIYPVKAQLMAKLCKIERPGMKLNGRFYRINTKKCVNCGQCVKNCPVGNIKQVDGKFVFGKNCIGCAKCAFNCPVDAFNTGFLNFLKVNGRYNFNAKEDGAKIGAYCKKSYIGYFDGTTERDKI